MRYIEFFGVPGSGKSTICSKLTDELNKKGCHAYDVERAKCQSIVRMLGLNIIYTNRDGIKTKTLKTGTRRIYNIFNTDEVYLKKFLVENTELASNIFNNINKNAPSKQREKLYTEWFINTMAQYEIANQHLKDQETLLLDEGFINRTMTLFLYCDEINKKLIKRYIKHIPKPDMLIIPEVPIETAYSRMKERSKGFPPAYAGLEFPQQRDILEKTKKLVQMVKSVIQYFDIQVYVLDNTRDIDLVVSEIIGEIQSNNINL